MYTVMLDGFQDNAKQLNRAVQRFNPTETKIEGEKRLSVTFAEWPPDEFADWLHSLIAEYRISKYTVMVDL